MSELVEGFWIHFCLVEMEQGRDWVSDFKSFKRILILISPDMEGLEEGIYAKHNKRKVVPFLT